MVRVIGLVGLISVLTAAHSQDMATQWPQASTKDMHYGDLQAQIQAQLQQQNLMQQQQQALLQGLQPVLEWGNHIKKGSNTGCNLDQYTGLLSLCQALSPVDTDISDSGGVGPPLKSCPDRGLESNAGCSCWNEWYYLGEARCGCQTTTELGQETCRELGHACQQDTTCALLTANWVTDHRDDDQVAIDADEQDCAGNAKCNAMVQCYKTAPQSRSSRPWCVLQPGCDGAHPGPWGSWDYCDGVDADYKALTTTADVNTTTQDGGSSDTGIAAGEQWVLEPQASFRPQDEPPLAAMCQLPMCAAGLTRLRDHCKDTTDAVMKAVVQHAIDAGCVNASTPFQDTISGRRYSVTLMMRSGATKIADQTAFAIIAELLGLDPNHIQNFEVDSAGQYTFDVVSDSLFRDDIVRLLQTVGDAEVVYTYGDGDSEDADGYASVAVPDNAAPANVQHSVPSSFYMMSMVISIFGTLTALSFFGVAGRMKRYASENVLGPGGKRARPNDLNEPLDFDREDTSWLPPPEGLFHDDTLSPWFSGNGAHVDSDSNAAGASTTSLHDNSDDDTSTYDDQYHGAYDEGQYPYTSFGGDDASSGSSPEWESSEQSDSMESMDESGDDTYVSYAPHSTEPGMKSEPDYTTPPVVAAQPVMCAPCDTLSGPLSSTFGADGDLLNMMRNSELEVQAYRERLEHELERVKAHTAGRPSQNVQVSVFMPAGGYTPQPSRVSVDVVGSAAAPAGFGRQPNDPRRERKSGTQTPPLVQGSVRPSGKAAPGEAPVASFVCPYDGCGYAATQRRYLKEHMRVHSGDRPYVCTWPGCNYASAGSGHVARHMRTHTGDRPYKCKVEGCGYAASQSGHLQTHILVHANKPRKSKGKR